MSHDGGETHTYRDIHHDVGKKQTSVITTGLQGNLSHDGGKKHTYKNTSHDRR